VTGPATRPGFELPLLLLAAFRSAIDGLHDELAERGHPQVRAIHGFALQGIGPDGASISELGRRLGVSKQAAAKTAANLERLGYAARAADDTDARAWRLHRTQRGEELLRLSATIFEAQRRRLVRQLGADRVGALEDDLQSMAGGADRSGLAAVADLPGWLG
jgi:DNA-binding MarR family transcriptional regulator